MNDNTYKIIEIVGSSTVGNDEAIRNAIKKARETVRHINWFEVIEKRGHVSDDKTVHFQVVLKIGFRLE
jgi:flavin-binding protein dodecin